MNIEPILYDPRVKKEIKDTLYTYLYAPITRQFKERLDGIINKNSLMIGASHNSFIYHTIIYSCDSDRLPKKMNQLLRQLHPTMDDYIKELDELNNTELPYVLGFINQVLNASNDLHDYLRVFPESVHKPIELIIATCPRRNNKLTEDAVTTMQQQNQTPITLIKKRMVTNLLI